MEQDKGQRRVKVVGGATHRVGTQRAAIKPHKRAEANVGKIVSDYLAGLRKGSLAQTYTGDTLAKNDRLLRSSFGLSASDEMYLLCDPTGTGKAGMLLAASGVHLADGRGGASTISWKDFKSSTVAYQRGMLVVGQSGISTRDAQSLVSLLKQIQSKLA